MPRTNSASRVRRTPVSGRVWGALAHAETPLSVPDLHAATGAGVCAIHKPLRAWAGAGIITIVEGRPRRFVMPNTTERTVSPPTVHHDGRIAIRPRSSRDRLWSALRTLKTFDLPMLELASSATPHQTRLYVGVLERCGFIQRIDGQADCPRFRVTRLCGPRAPSITQHREDGRWLRQLVDPNNGIRFTLSPRRSRPPSSPAIDDRGEG